MARQLASQILGRVEILVLFLFGSAAAQLIPGDPKYSRWPLDETPWWRGVNPWIALQGNEPTVCKENGVVVPCKKIDVLHAIFTNKGPTHVAFALYSTLHMGAKLINQAQEMLPGYELVINTVDTKWSALQKDKIIADEVLTKNGSYPIAVGSYNLDGGFNYLLDTLRMPMISASISQQMADPDMNPGGVSTVNHGMTALDAIGRIFKRCDWKRMGVITDPVQFGYESANFKKAIKEKGFAIDFEADLNQYNLLENAVKLLKRARSRVVVVFAEAVPLVWLACHMHLHGMSKVVIMHWPAVPWPLNAVDAQDSRCKNPNVLLEAFKGYYIGIYPATMDLSPAAPVLTCHPNAPKDAVLGQTLGYMGAAIASGEGVPFGVVPHFGGFDNICMLVQYLRHMLFDKGYTLEEVSARTPEIYEEYKSWAFPDFVGAAGPMRFEKIYDAAADKWVLQRLPYLEFYQITGSDMTKSPMFNAPPPWDFGPLMGFYEQLQDDTIVADVLDQITFNGSPECPADLFEPCPEGHQLYMGECQPCEPGTYLGDQGECLPCLRGMYQPNAGSLLCLGCPLGTSSNTTRNSECTACEPGFSRPSGTPADRCLPCSPGSFTSEAQRTEAGGMAECRPCPEGTFAEDLGSTQCAPCPSGFWTMERGSASAELCLCGANQYRDAATRLCEPCPKGMECSFGADVAPGSISSPRLLPGYWSSPEDSLSTYRCDSVSHCVGGAPSSSTCGPHLEGRSCANCRDGYIWGGDACIECTSFERTSILFPIIPLILGPLVPIAMYVTSRDDYQKWGNWKTQLASVGFICLNHYQLVTLLKSAETELPGPVDGALSVWLFTSDVLTLFKPPCAGMNSSLNVLIFKALGPVIVFGIFMATCGASQLVARATKKNVGMKLDIVLNAYCSIIFSFFAGIAQAAFTVLKCGPNPSKKWTMNADKSIVCFEGEWMEMLTIGILSVLFWCVGFGALFSWAIAVAPRRWKSQSFRLRWKFLFIKFRSGGQWFSMAIVLKGVLCNVGFIFLPDSLMQIYWTLLFFSVYCALVIIFKPWRIFAINAADIFAHFSLNILGTLLTWFVPADASLDQTVQTICIATSFLALPVSAAVAAYMATQQTAARFRSRKVASIEEVRGALAMLAATDKERLEGFLASAEEYDFRAFRTVASSVATAGDKLLADGPAASKGVSSQGGEHRVHV